MPPALDAYGTGPAEHLKTLDIGYRLDHVDHLDHLDRDRI